MEEKRKAIPVYPDLELGDRSTSAFCACVKKVDKFYTYRVRLAVFVTLAMIAILIYCLRTNGSSSSTPSIGTIENNDILRQS